jgi:hypothetical protein
VQPIQFTRPDRREVELQPWSDADLDRMATLTETDQRRAASYWRRFLPRRLRDLLDAISTIANAL